MSDMSIDEANIANTGWFDYPCFDEFSNMFSMCGADLYEMLTELYRQRLFGSTEKAPNYSKIMNTNDQFNMYNDRKTLHY